MAKLYFRYGSMGSAKTLNLLAVRFNYVQQNKRVIVVKPIIDDRYGEDIVKSRAPLEHKAEVLVRPDSPIVTSFFCGSDCILVDECQFLTASQIDTLREVTMTYDIPVICYGLRTDFQGYLFDGARRLFEVADTIEEIKTTCQFCNRKATFNLRLEKNGKGATSGPQIIIGANEMYVPVCYQHFFSKGK